MDCEIKLAETVKLAGSGNKALIEFEGEQLYKIVTGWHMPYPKCSPNLIKKHVRKILLKKYVNDRLYNDVCKDD